MCIRYRDRTTPLIGYRGIISVAKDAIKLNRSGREYRCDCSKTEAVVALVGGGGGGRVEATASTDTRA